MKPLNEQERRIALLKFIGIFLFTIFLVVFAIYFDYSSVPAKELQYYKSRCGTLQDSIASDIALYNRLTELNTNLAKYQAAPTDPLAQTAVSSNIVALTDLAKKDSLNFSGKIAAQAAAGYTIAVSSIVKVKESGDAAGDNTKLNADLAKLQTESDKKDQQIKDLQAKIEKCKKW